MRQDMHILPQLQALTAREREMLDSLESELFIPIVTRGGLRGILILDRKLSEQDYSPGEIRMLREAAREMADTLDNARLYDLQTRRYREQLLLTRLSMIVSSELDLNRVCHYFVKELQDVLSVDYASISLIDERGKPPISAFVWSTLPDLQSAGEDTGNFSMARPHTPLATEQELHYEPNLTGTAKSPADKKFHQAGIRSVLHLPLQSNTGTLGHFTLAARGPDAYHEDNLRLLQQVAVQLAIAVDNSRLYELEREARRELKKQYNERTEFINALIHEVKTPITAMLASSELLREELPADSSTLGALAENLDIATHNLDRRISELMDFVKLQSTETKLHLQPVDIHEVAERTASYVTGLLRNKHQTLNLELPPSLDPVRADPDRLVQILLNLLTNASKFSDPHQSICLRVYPDNTELIVELSDSAPPIKPQEAELIFRPYHQNRRKGSGGLGLGLFICKKLVQLHGGRIWVETDSNGNRFKFSLPLVANKRGKT